MGVHAKGICKKKYRIQTKYTFNRCQRKFTLLIIYTHTKKPTQKTNRFVVFVCKCMGYDYVNYDNNI